MSSRILFIGLVLGAGVVALYLATRDRWDWAQLVRRAFFALVIVIGAAWAWIYWSSLPPTAPVTELWGIALGASESDVLFLKGEPDEISDPHTWVYMMSRNRTYNVVFGETDQVVSIRLVPGAGYSSGLPLLGVRAGFDESRLIEQLGEPARVVALADDLRRAYLYPRLNALFILERGTVVSLGIYDTAAGDLFPGATGAAGGS